MNGLVLKDVAIRYGRGQAERTAVSGVNLATATGSALGLVGESGCGKSSLARAIAGMQPISDGQILLDGRDVASLRRGGQPFPIQLVFQNSLAALDPRRTAGQSISEALEGRGIRGRAAEALVEHHLDQVELDPAHGRQRPGQLSGGQRQRVAIARALAAQPQVIVADEITSALDVSVQAAILNLLVRLRAELGFTLVFISHNLAAVRFISDEIAVMRAGHIVESGPAEAVTNNPSHPYTRTLLEAAPWLGARQNAQPVLDLRTEKA